MTQFLPLVSAPVLILITALSYTLATVGMKLVSQDIVPIGAALLILGLVVAVLAEIALLRKTDLSIVYITIVASETILVLLYAAMIGEGFGLRQATGAALVVAGLLAVSV
ncbi:MAG: 5-aminolevulinate synthase [Paracoccaceae bacterium]|nr:5-aminolevulinate synthase [Paracoccaceae bacterium]